jgi:hypothetical protein
MLIYGLSQSSGVERQVQVEGCSEGIVLIITDQVGGVERERIVVSSEALQAAVMDRPPGGSTIEGTSLPQGVTKRLDIEVRRNEVLLRTRAVMGEGADAAVGLDDFQDALAVAIPPA